MMFATLANAEKIDSFYFRPLEVITVFTSKLSNHISDIPGLSELRDSLTVGKSYYCL